MYLKIVPNNILNLQVKKSLFLLVEASLNGSTLFFSLTVLNLSSVEPALMVAPFLFNKDSARLKIAEIVVFGTLMTSRSDGAIGTFLHSGRFVSLFNNDCVVCWYFAILDSIVVAQC